MPVTQNGCHGTPSRSLRARAVSPKRCSPGRPALRPSTRSCANISTSRAPGSRASDYLVGHRRLGPDDVMSPAKPGARPPTSSALLLVANARDGLGTPICFAAMQAIMLTSSGSVTAIRRSARSLRPRQGDAARSVTGSCKNIEFFARPSADFGVTIDNSHLVAFQLRMAAMWNPTSPAPTTTAYMALSSSAGPSCAPVCQGSNEGGIRPSQTPGSRR